MPPKDFAEARVSHALIIAFIFCSLLFGLLGIGLRSFLRLSAHVQVERVASQCRVRRFIRGRGDSLRGEGETQCHTLSGTTSVPAALSSNFTKILSKISIL